MWRSAALSIQVRRVRDYHSFVMNGSAPVERGYISVATHTEISWLPAQVILCISHCAVNLGAIWYTHCKRAMDLTIRGEQVKKNRIQIYDASYLAVAHLYDCELWTADGRLYNAVHSKLPWVRWIEEV